MKNIIIIVLILIVVGVAAYFMFGKKKKVAPSTTPDASPTTSANLGVGESILSEAEKAKKAQIEAIPNWVAYIKDKADKAGITYAEHLIKDVKYCVKTGKC